MKKTQLSKNGYKLFRLNGELTDNILAKLKCSKEDLTALINEYYDYIDTSGNFYNEGAFFRLNDDGLILLENYRYQRRTRLISYISVALSLVAIIISIVSLILKA